MLQNEMDSVLLPQLYASSFQCCGWLYFPSLHWSKYRILHRGNFKRMFRTYKSSCVPGLQSSELIYPAKVVSLVAHTVITTLPLAKNLGENIPVLFSSVWLRIIFRRDQLLWCTDPRNKEVFFFCLRQWMKMGFSLCFVKNSALANYVEPKSKR